VEIYQTEEQQVEAIKGYWEQNGNMIIAGIVLGFAGFIGFNFYKDSQLDSEIAISDSYQKLIESSEKDKAAFSQNAEKFISENAGTSYVSLTSLALAKTAADNKDWATAETQLTTALENAPTDGIKGIVSLRLARVQVQQEKYELALATLGKPLPDSFIAAIEEIKGDTYLLQGKQELARNSYQVAIAADGLASSPNLQMKLDDLATAINLTTTVPAAK
jgi:predicted negative regulator of RcsB-dependent stress response